MEAEAKRVQGDIEQAKRIHRAELDKVNSEMGEVRKLSFSLNMHCILPF